MMAKDLERWNLGGADTPPGMGQLLDSAKSDLPSSAQLGSLAGKLGPLLDAPPPPAGLPVDATAGPGMPTLAKLAVLVAVGGLVGTGAWLMANQDGDPRATQQRAPAVTPDSNQPLPVVSEAAEPPAVNETAERPAASTTPTEPEASALPEAPTAAARPKAKQPAARPKPSEAALLSQAQQALKSDPKRALALTRQHKRLYPSGALAQEREVIAIEALSRLDQKNSAQEKANSFSEKYPESAHQKKVDTTLKQ